MDNKELSVEELKSQLGYLRAKYDKAMHSMTSQLDYTMELEVENDLLKTKLNELMKESQG
ncbi:TPA: hypothetical protein K8030_000951 [Staphylococcus pseudintermedius]|nr:hypothetical protein [Staphylococcus pseudintermedius]MDK3694455.1 hypothetical protein [Staphylococcus pseudintermedius]HAR6353782.1 hypothetical protein [Staphylococcus pseudintermedius]HCA7011882.1 hypothetical protein [Staphylococcus pseudintermedius]